MHISVDNKDSEYYVVIEIDKKELIGWCQWADDEKGEYCVVKTDKDGDPIVTKNASGTLDMETETKRGNIRIIDIRKIEQLAKIYKKIQNKITEIEDAQIFNEDLDIMFI